MQARLEAACRAISDAQVPGPSSGKKDVTGEGSSEEESSLGLGLTCPLPLPMYARQGNGPPKAGGDGQGSRAIAAGLLPALRAMALVTLTVTVHRTQVTAPRLLTAKSWLCCSVVNSNSRKDRFFCVGCLCFLL